MPLVTLGGVRESIVSFMAMDDLWRRRVPEHKGWQISVVWFLPAVDVLVGALVALAVGRGPGGHLDLAGGQHPHAGVLPAAGAVVELAQHP